MSKNEISKFLKTDDMILDKLTKCVTSSSDRKQCPHKKDVICDGSKTCKLTAFELLMILNKHR